MFQGKLFTSNFLQAAVAGPILGIDFLRKLKVTVTAETSQIIFACTAAASSAPEPFLLSFDSSIPPPVVPPSGGHSPCLCIVRLSLSGETDQFFSSG
jgi:hypothetical protein